MQLQTGQKNQGFNALYDIQKDCLMVFAVQTWQVPLERWNLFLLRATLTQSEAKELISDLQRAVEESADHEVAFPVTIMSESSVRDFVIYVGAK